MAENKNEHEYPFFTNTDCEFFPCHDNVPLDDFNCIFCYCPLYALGERCGGNYSYDNKKGVKACAACGLPHSGDDGTRHVKEKYKLIAELAKRTSSDES